MRRGLISSRPITKWLDRHRRRVHVRVALRHDKAKRYRALSSPAQVASSNVASHCDPASSPSFGSRRFGIIRRGSPTVLGRHLQLYRSDMRDCPEHLLRPSAIPSKRTHGWRLFTVKACDMEHGKCHIIQNSTSATRPSDPSLPKGNNVDHLDHFPHSCVSRSIFRQAESLDLPFRSSSQSVHCCTAGRSRQKTVLRVQRVHRHWQWHRQTPGIDLPHYL